MSKIRNNAATLLCGAMILSLAGAADAGIVAEPIALSIENVNDPANYYRSVYFIPVDQQGEPLTSGTFDASIAPEIFLGDEASNVARPFESFTFMDDLGNPGNTILKIDFGTAMAWSPGEMLTFTFTLNYEEGVAYKIDAQFSLVPSPGAAVLMAGAGLYGLRRRRS